MLIEKQSQAGKSFLMQSALVSTGAFFFCTHYFPWIVLMIIFNR